MIPRTKTQIDIETYSWNFFVNKLIWTSPIVLGFMGWDLVWNNSELTLFAFNVVVNIPKFAYSILTLIIPTTG